MSTIIQRKSGLSDKLRLQSMPVETPLKPPLTYNNNLKGDVASQENVCFLYCTYPIAAITGFLTFYWSGRTASTLLIQ